MRPDENSRRRVQHAIGRIELLDRRTTTFWIPFAKDLLEVTVQKFVNSLRHSRSFQKVFGPRCFCVTSFLTSASPALDSQWRRRPPGFLGLPRQIPVTHHTPKTWTQTYMSSGKARVWSNGAGLDGT